MMRTLACTLAGVAVLFSTGASAVTFNVDNAADIPDALPGDGKCSFIPNPPQTPGLCTLRAAVMEANASVAFDTIVLQNGVTYLLTAQGRGEDQAATGDLDIRQPVKIWAGLLGQATIQANGIDRNFQFINVGGSGVTMSGLTLAGGNFGGEFSDKGAGIQIYGSTATLTFLTVLPEMGEGIAVAGGASTRTTIISHSQLSGSANHDALAISWAQGVLSSSTLLNSSKGVDIQGLDGVLLMDTSTVSGNASDGVHAYFGGSVHMVNSTIANNGGQGLRVSDGSATVENSLFASNGSSCYADNSTVVMKANMYDDISCPWGGVGDDSLYDTPAYLSLLGYHGGLTPTHRPMTNSAAIDRTIGAVCDDYETDQRLMPRKVGFKGSDAKCDVGAVELETDVIYFDQFDRL